MVRLRSIAALGCLAAVAEGTLTVTDAGTGTSSANGGIQMQSTIVVNIATTSPLADDGQRIVCVAYRPGSTAPVPANNQFATLDTLDCAGCEATVAGGTGTATITISRDTAGNILTAGTLYRVICNDDPTTNSAGGTTGGQRDITTAPAPTLVITRNFATTTSRQLGVTVTGTGGGTTNLLTGQQVACAAQVSGGASPGGTFAAIQAGTDTQNACPSLVNGACVATVQAAGTVLDANNVNSLIITVDSDGNAIRGGTDYIVSCRDGPGTTTNTDTALLSISNPAIRSKDDCKYDQLSVTIGSVVRTGADIQGYGVTVAYAGTGGTTGNCVAGQDIIQTNGACSMSLLGYQDATQTCSSSGTWQTTPLVAESCAISSIPNSDRSGALDLLGVTLDTIAVTCDVGYTCSGSTATIRDRSCSVVCAPPTSVATKPGVFQQSLTQTGLPTCDQDCSVGSVTGAAVATISGGSCVEGGTVPSGASCQWTADAGYDCSNLGTAQCGVPTAGTLGAGTPACQEKLCTTFTFVTGITGGATVPSCTTTTKLSAVTNRQCSLACDTAAGYVGSTGTSAGTLSCPIGGGAPTRDLTCVAMTCSTAFNFASSGVLTLADVTACDAIDETGTPCSLTCDSSAGFVAGVTGSPLLSCVLSGTTATWQLTRPCVGPATCGASSYTCPNGYTVNAGGICTDVTLVSGAARCATSTTNTGICCPAANAAPCPAFSTGAGVCSCDAGYSGTPSWNGATWTHTCTELTCGLITYRTGWVGSQPDPCSPTLQLGAAIDTSCTMECLPGYVAAGATLRCSATGTLLAPQPTTFTDCVEKVCRAYTLPTGTASGTTGTPCTNGIVLTQVNNPTCTLSCATGYTGPTTTISCGTDLGSNSLPTGTPACTEVSCGAYNFGPGVTGFAVDGCSDGIVLSAVTDVSCNVVCQQGWSPLPDNVNFYTVTCAQTSASGAAPTGGVTCTKTCGLHACATGYVARPDGAAESFLCANNICDDAQCCVPASCPQYATGVGICTCDAGYRISGGGAPVWNAALNGGQWTHTCIPTCDNQFFGGCVTAGYSLRPSPELVFCVAGAACDNTGCSSCTEAICCEPNVCQPPGTNYPAYAIPGGATCTTAPACGTPGCARGFTGTATLVCPATGGVFRADGCTAVDCPANAAGAGTCNCQQGYMVSGGGSPVWDQAARVWRHVCVPVCANTAFTGCSATGLTFKANPQSIACTGTGTTPDTMCTQAQCCDALCTIQGFTSCANAGFLPKLDVATLSCAGYRAIDCSVQQCCDASCSNTAYLGCSASGFQRKSNAATIHCGDSTTASCTQDLCCDVIHCDQYQCPYGWSQIPGSGVCGGICQQTQCCRENICIAVGTSYPGYTLLGGTSCTSVTGCGQVTCTEGTHHPVFNTTLGSVPCTLGPVPAGTTHVPCTLGGATAGGRAIADAVAGQDGPRLLCPTYGGQFIALGCAENVCTAPNTAAQFAGYVFTGPRSCTTVGECGSISCRPGYVATSPALRCEEDGGTFVAAGCREFRCNLLPVPAFAGYSFSGECPLGGASTLTQCGQVTCNPGYSATAGVPALTCNADGRNFTAHGCTINPCVAPGTANSVPGYVASNPSCVVATDCGSISCARGYLPEAGETPRLVCLVPGGLFTGDGCEAVDCPDGATGAGVCACADGYTGTPVWDGTRWTHTCTAVPCPANAGTPGVCACNVGFFGVAAWSGTSWTHSCAPRPCPANAAGAGCNCTEGYAPIPTWGWSAVAGVWLHTCRIAVCARGLPFGYQASGGASCTTVTSCGTVTCGPGYLTAGTPRLTCPADGAALIGSGCLIVTCPTGGDPARGCACFDGYIGAPVWDGAAWVHTCTAVDCPANTVSTAAERCRCADGYIGTPLWTGITWAHTCTPVACPAGTSPPGVCNCARGYAPQGTKLWTGTAWDFVCTPVPCPGSAMGIGTCECGRGFAGTPSWSGTAWTHTCSAAVCPLNAAGSGCPCINGFSGTPQWSTVTQSWVHSCVAVGCPVNAGGTGCQCNQGFIGTPLWSGTAWVHSCSVAPCPAGASGVGCVCSAGLVGTPIWSGSGWTHFCANPAVACPANAGPAGICTCNAGFTGTPAWNGVAWTHVCVATGTGQNVPPTGVVSVPVVTAPAVASPASGVGVITGITAPEVGQTVSSQCAAVVPTLFSSQPSLSMVGSTATVLFTPVAGLTPPRETQVNCDLIDNGVPVGTTRVSFVIRLVAATSPCPSRPCGGTCVLAQTGTAARQGAGTVIVTPFVTNLGGLGVACTAGDPLLFAVQPAVSTTGQLSWAPSATRSGSTSVTCTATDACNQQTTFVYTTTVTPPVAIATPVPTPVPVVPGTPSELLWIRVPLGQVVAAFNRASFVSAVQSVLRPELIANFRSVVVHWVCPASACPSGVCPGPTAARIQAGCRTGNSFSERRAEPSQAINSYVDFDVVTTAPEGTAARATDRRQAAADVSQELTKCNAGQACVFQLFQPVPNAPVTLTSQTPTVTAEPASSDDESMPGWLIAVIVICAVLLCLLLLLLLFCLTRGKKKNRDRQRLRKTDSMGSQQGVLLRDQAAGAYGQHQSPPRDLGGEPFDPAVKPSYPHSQHHSQQPSAYDDTYYSSYGTEGEGGMDRGDSQTGASDYGPWWDGASYARGETVQAQYIDGMWYDGTIWNANPPDDDNPEGTYNIRWFDGSHSEGVPPRQIQSAAA